MLVTEVTTSAATASGESSVATPSTSQKRQLETDVASDGVDIKKIKTEKIEPESLEQEIEIAVEASTSGTPP